MMGKILKELTAVPFDRAKTIVDESYFTKTNGSGWVVMIVYAFCIFLSFLPLQNSIFVTIALIFLNSTIIIGYFMLRQGRQYLDKTLIGLTIYLLAQITIFSLPLGLSGEDGPIYGEYYFVVASIYIIISLTVAYWRTKRLVLKYASEQDIMKAEHRKHTGKIDRIVGYLLGGFIVVILVIMQGYRFTKIFRATGNQDSFSFGSNNILSFILVFSIYILLSVIYALLPTLIFDEKKIVYGVIVQKNSEQFRIEQESTPLDWYGEKWSE